MTTLREQVEGLPTQLLFGREVVNLSGVLALLPAQGVKCPCGEPVLAVGHNCSSCVEILERNATPAQEAGAQEPTLAERIRAITGIPLSRAAFVVACLESAKTKLPGSHDVIDGAIREEQAIARLLDELLYAAPLPAAAPAPSGEQGTALLCYCLACGSTQIAKLDGVDFLCRQGHMCAYYTDLATPSVPGQTSVQQEVSEAAVDDAMVAFSNEPKCPEHEATRQGRNADRESCAPCLRIAIRAALSASRGGNNGE